jgi:hypothetical protein
MMGRKALGCAPLLLLLAAAVAPAELSVGAAAASGAVTRADFPAGFVFGVGSSAYQVRLVGGAVSLFVPMVARSMIQIRCGRVRSRAQPNLG